MPEITTQKRDKMQEEITLCEQINDSEVEKTIIFCDVESITQSEFEAVGQKDI